MRGAMKPDFAPPLGDLGKTGLVAAPARAAGAAARLAFGDAAFTADAPAVRAPPRSPRRAPPPCAAREYAAAVQLPRSRAGTDKTCMISHGDHARGPARLPLSATRRGGRGPRRARCAAR